MPTNTQMRFGSRISVSGERCAYLDGSAYLLDLRCFLEGRVEILAASSLTEALLLVCCSARLGTRGSRGVELAVEFCIVVVLYWNFRRAPLNVGGGPWSASSSWREVEANVAVSATASSLTTNFPDRVRAIVVLRKKTGSQWTLGTIAMDSFNYVFQEKAAAWGAAVL